MVRHFLHDEVATCAAYLHDVVEDCAGNGWGFDYLQERGVKDSRIIHLLDVLTHRNDEDYHDYISRVIEDSREARIIKLCDMVDNLRDTPSKSQVEKYTATILRLALHQESAYRDLLEEVADSDNPLRSWSCNNWPWNSYLVTRGASSEEILVEHLWQAAKYERGVSVLPVFLRRCWGTVPEREVEQAAARHEKELGREGDLLRLQLEREALSEKQQELDERIERTTKRMIKESVEWYRT